MTVFPQNLYIEFLTPNTSKGMYICKIFKEMITLKWGH